MGAPIDPITSLTAMARELERLRIAKTLRRRAAELDAEGYGSGVNEIAAAELRAQARALEETEASL